MMLYILARDHWEKDLKERKYAARSRTDAALKSITADNDDNNDNDDYGVNGGGNDDDGNDSDNDIEEAAGDIDGSTTTMIINYKEATKQSQSFPYSGSGGGVVKARTTIDVEVEVIGNRTSGHVMSIDGSRTGGCDDDNDVIDDDNDIDDDDNNMVNDGGSHLQSNKC
jgi:hypothetical protein